MKKITLFTLAILIFSGSMQPVTAMQPFGPGLEESLNPAAPAHNTTVNIGVAVNPHQAADIYDLQVNQGILTGLTLATRMQQINSEDQLRELRENAAANLNQQQNMSNIVLQTSVEQLNTRNSKAAYQAAKAKAKSEGRAHGMLGGVFSGSGYSSALACLLFAPSNIWLMMHATKFSALQSVSYYKSRVVKKEYYYSLRTNETITPEQKIKLKKTYHTEEFKANALTSAATAVGITAATLAINYAILPNDQKPAIQSTATSFWNYLPHAVLGITALKWLTYTGMRSYKKWSRGDQPPRRRQQPYLRAQVP